MVGVENVEEWSKRRNGWGEGGGRFEVENVEEWLRGGTVGVENVEEWSKRRNGWSGEMDGAAGEL
ncbi:hypothetical protein B9Z19DRAFT_1071389 [Tuber borchii]|uniref:Uncharacterized protein n=1 Tax=Tuber borchii TaxID=42251 RepID=A0A2T7A7Z7_TUBBO|nr:hypothetical protein B9Z19DRAFT_1071389 [Tuber borchii]